MLISVLRVRSPLLDVDKLLASHPTVRPDAIWHIGEARDSHRTYSDSGFYLSLVDDDDRTWAVLVQQTFAELDRLSPLLLDVQRAGSIPAVDYGVSVGTTEAFVRSCHFGAVELQRFVQLGVSVCVTAYPTRDDEP